MEAPEHLVIKPVVLPWWRRPEAALWLLGPVTLVGVPVCLLTAWRQLHRHQIDNAVISYLQIGLLLMLWLLVKNGMRFIEIIETQRGQNRSLLDLLGQQNALLHAIAASEARLTGANEAPAQAPAKLN